MNTLEFIGYVKSPSLLNTESLSELKELLKEFPFCSTCRILLAKNYQKLNTNEASEFIKNASIFLPDRKKFFRIIHNIPDDVIVQHQAPVYSLEMLDDKSGNAETEINYLEKNTSDSLIDKFIREKPVITYQPEENDTDEDILPESEKEKEFISEILAELYWRQGNPNKAIRTYEKLSLKYPEKNSYFAARIEKIKKESLNN